MARPATGGADVPSVGYPEPVGKHIHGNGLATALDGRSLVPAGRGGGGRAGEGADD